MNRLALLVLSVVFGLFALSSLEARADKTQTLLSAPATITALHFYPPGDGGTMQAQACGQTRFSDGGQTSVSCWDVSLPPGNSINTTVQSLATGSARTFWMTQEGL